MNITWTKLFLCCVFFWCSMLFADVDKIYHPYVEQNTYELESRAITKIDNDLLTNFSLYRLGFGKDVTEKLFLEFYLIGAKTGEQNLQVNSYELEALYQFTEQGEYWADIAFLIELQRDRLSKEWEGNFALIAEKEFGRWSATVNIHNLYQFIEDQRHEWKFEQSFQFRYRYRKSFEPGIEIYSDNQSLFVGPVIMGQVKFGHQRLSWEIGLDQKLSRSEDDTVLRALLEFEF